MRILAVNCGSSTLKFRLVEARRSGALGGDRALAGGVVERIGGGQATLAFDAEAGERERRGADVPDHEEAVRLVLGWLRSGGLVAPEGPDGVGHRVVHGADLFSEPALIGPRVMSAVEGLADLAPLHNGPSVSAIRSAQKVLGGSVPMVAVFDTAFHRTLPEHAYRYPIPWDLAEKHRVRRYGFHGTAHRYMAERWAALTGTSLDETSLVTLQLGNGCSATAIGGGRSVETSMGLTPLEGLMMGTRSGSVDPAIIPLLSRREGVDATEVEGWLNRRSGLLGVSGTSRDLRELLEAEAAGDARAALAIEMFCHRVRQYVGAYLAVLGGAEAVVFGGGIGENAPTIRERVCAAMGWCGLELDGERNASAAGSEGRISTDASKLGAYVIRVDEEAMIARDTVRCLLDQGPRPEASPEYTRS